MKDDHAQGSATDNKDDSNVVPLIEPPTLNGNGATPVGMDKDLKAEGKRRRL